jgi:hypothetical protein
LTWTTTSGGKSSGTARARALVEASQAFSEEAFAPQGDDVTADGQRGRNLVIAEALGRSQDDAGAQYLKVWQRILAGETLEASAFVP